MAKLYIGNSNNTPTRIKKLWIGNSNNTPVRIKKLWIGNSSNRPVLIFTEGATEGFVYDFDASYGQDNSWELNRIINSVDNVPHELQPILNPVIPNKTWVYSSIDGRPRSFNNNKGSFTCGRGGTFRLPTTVNDATIALVQRLDMSALTQSDSFTNCCYFNQRGNYVYYPDRYEYTGAQIGILAFRRVNNDFQVGDIFNWQTVNFINKNLCVVWMYTSGSQIKYEIVSSGGQRWSYQVQKTNNYTFQDIRICDWAGGGVRSLSGELYEFLIWPKALTQAERQETEEYLLDKWQ